jgi:hypothetical protein
VAKKRKLDPNRFQQQDQGGLFSFDPVRRQVLLWGLIAGAVGAFLMIQTQLWWQILGVLVVVFVSNYHINRAARRIPRWQATALSFAGVLAALIVVSVAGTLVQVYLQGNGA